MSPSNEGCARVCCQRKYIREVGSLWVQPGGQGPTRSLERSRPHHRQPPHPTPKRSPRAQATSTAQHREERAGRSCRRPRRNIELILREARAARKRVERTRRLRLTSAMTRIARLRRELYEACPSCHRGVGFLDLGPGRVACRGIGPASAWTLQSCYSPCGDEPATASLDRPVADQPLLSRLS